MRILLVSSSFARTSDAGHNAGGFVRDVAAGLVTAGHDVVVLTPQTVDDPEGFRVVGIPRIGAETSLSHLDPSGWRDRLELASVIVGGSAAAIVCALRFRPDRMIGFWALPAGLMAATARLVTRRPYDIWALGSDVWRIDDYPLGRQILRFVLRGADRRFADGTDLAAAVESASGLECGFLPSSRRLPPPSTSVDRDTPTRRFRLMAVARFHPHKGIDVLVDALALLPDPVRAGLDVQIWGGGPDEERLRSMIDHHRLHETVTLRGFISAQEFVDRATTADAAVIPSRLESIPVILSDYAQCDTPLIVTDTGDLGRLVAEHDAGIVVPAGDADSLATAIATVVGGTSAGTSCGRTTLADQLGLDHAIRTLGAPLVT